MSEYVFTFVSRLSKSSWTMLSSPDWAAIINGVKSMPKGSFSFTVRYVLISQEEGSNIVMPSQCSFKQGCLSFSLLYHHIPLHAHQFACMLGFRYDRIFCSTCDMFLSNLGNILILRSSMYRFRLQI